MSCAWCDCTKVEIVEIRPPTALAGNAFDGLFRASLRDDYVEAGEDAAHAWLTGTPGALTRDAG